MCIRKRWCVLFLLAVLAFVPVRAQSPGKPAVPESWKQANGGPYVQGPDGLWWYVSPFNPEPWRAFSPKTAPPPGFVEVYGPEPNSNDFPSGQFLAYAAAHDKWLQDRKYFKGIGLPEWATQAQLDAANKLYEFWDMGHMLIYEGRYGWSARFTGARQYEFAAHTAINFPHVGIAVFQVSELEAGRVPAKKHPFVPPQLWPDYKPDPQAHSGP